ncbi:polymer-forming cytoskeletal domain-containing [Fusarium longipes]|uniref:Polymer-forming cytoskeletal domain-containing n=1 Tax=Fusarium longipes TaxID=694270 RepID=A0A395T0R6_9HYPO|nr:polymer-forming cytoskeletal domain-containing [Fusarium longipes]
MSSYYTQPAYKRSRGVKSDHEITINGPVDVAGSVKSGSSINLNGDVIVREKLDAYGAIALNGSIRCDGKVQAYGTISVNGYTVANDKIKGRGKLRVVGTLQGTDLEIYGNITITGHLRLVAYGNITLIGSESTYYAEESQQITGVVMMKEAEPDWEY